MKKSLLFILTLFLPVFIYSQAVFINEFHYDDAGTDSGEGVEIAGPAGTDLSTFSVEAYNGNGGASYSTTTLSGTIPDQQNGFGTLWFAISGLQNGAPDGIALVNNGTVVIQFLSYEGSFTAADGPAMGITSEDILVAESGVPEGYSLQLAGSGEDYVQFSWQSPAVGTQGQVNTGQTFVSAGPDIDPPVWTTGYPYAKNVVDDKGTIVVNMNEPGIVYYMMVDAGTTPAPTSAEVKAGVDYGPGIGPAGNFAVTAAGTDFEEVITGATPETSYDIYIVAEDAVLNLQATPAMVNITTTPLRSLAFTNPQVNDIMYIGDTLSIEWTSANIDSLLIAAYSYIDDEIFLVTEVNGEFDPVEAAAGVYKLWIPHDADPGNYDFLLYDYYDTSYHVRMGPVTLEDNRALELTNPVDYQSYYLGDTVLFRWTYSGIDSVLLGAYNYGEDAIFIFTMNEKTGEPEPLAADRDTFSLQIPPGADVDSIDLLIFDYYDTAFYDRVLRVYLVDTLTPKIDDLFPANGSLRVPLGVAFAIEFNEEVFAGTGSFYLRNEDGSLVESFDIAGLTIFYNSISFMPSAPLESGKTYYIDWDNGVVKDRNGLNFIGVTGDGSWKFTTGADIFFTEYIEGSGNNKALEIFNPTSGTVSLKNYRIAQSSNGSDWLYYHHFPEGAEIAAGDMWVILNDGTDPLLFDPVNADEVLSWPSVVHHNGDDARGIEVTFDGGDSWTLIDVIGIPWEDPGTGWDVAGVPAATANHTLLRKSTVGRGNTDWLASAGTNKTDSEWLVADQNYFDNLGFTSPEGSDDTELEAIMLYDTLLNNVTVTSVVDSLAGTASVEILFGMDSQLDSLVAMLTLAGGVTSSPASGDTLDFTNPVVFTVTAEDGITTRDWTVTVTVSASASSDAEILSFVIPNSATDAVIDSGAGTVTLTMPFGTDLTALVPDISISAGATVSPESGVAQDFSVDVVYTVTAQDATTKDWTVTVLSEEALSASIYEIQYTTDASGDSPLNGDLVKTRGIITAIANKYSFEGYFIQAEEGAWNGIYVYDVDRHLTDNPQLGDSIEIVGTVDEYYNLTEIKNILEYTNLSTGNSLPGPVEVTTGNASAEEYEGVFMNIHAATCTNSDLGYGEVEMDDGSGVVRLDDFLFAYDPFVLNNKYHVTGVMYYSFDNWKLLPGSAADISDVTGIKEIDLSGLIRLYPNPNDGRFTIEIPAEMKGNIEISVMNMTGKLIHKEIIGNVSYNVLPFDLSNKANGLYFIKISDGTNTAIAKFMKQ